MWRFAVMVSKGMLSGRMAVLLQSTRRREQVDQRSLGRGRYDMLLHLRTEYVPKVERICVLSLCRSVLTAGDDILDQVCSVM